MQFSKPPPREQDKSCPPKLQTAEADGPTGSPQRTKRGRLRLGFDLFEQQETAVRLALRPRDAAKALGISERLLWSMTNRGEIPHVRMGRAVVYPVDDLNRWLSEQAQKKAGRR